MDETLVVAISDGTTLRLPTELASELDSRLLMIERAGDGIFVSAMDPMRVAKRLARRRHFRLARSTASENGATIRASVPPGMYRIVNYHPRYYLMPDRFGGRAAESRLRSWAAESGYHEHLEPASQDAHSRWFSEWFATSIVAPRQPVRVLELGCGAGRNLAAIQAALPGVEVVGVEINEAAVTVSRAATGAQIVHGSIYELGDLGRFDVAFTAGVLMHIPHENVEGVIRSMVACADATAHFELHGAPHRFDFHRYPRDSGATYAGMDLGGFRYEVFPRGDIRNGGESVGTMALLSRPALPL